MEYSEEEQAVLDRFPGVSLHQIDKNRICLSLGQLKMIFGFDNKVFNDYFLNLCEEKLKKNGGKSLDFFDVSNIIDKAMNRSKSINIGKENQEKETPKEKKEKNYGNMSQARKENEIDALKKRVNELEKRLNDVEQKIKDIMETI